MELSAHSTGVGRGLASTIVKNGVGVDRFVWKLIPQVHFLLKKAFQHIWHNWYGNPMPQGSIENEDPF